MTTEKPEDGKKELILETARELGVSIFTPAEIEQIRRQLLVRLGVEGRISPEHIAAVLVEAGLPVRRARAAGATRYEEEFHDLLRFATLEDAEMCLIRLDELLRKFREQGDHAGEARVVEVAQLGHRRAMMIARNAKVEPEKRAEKEEVGQWFKVWLENPEAFFDWLELRKQAPEFRRRFGGRAPVES
jgi:hypothetical protein